MSALKYWLWLTRLKGVRNQTRHLLLKRFVSPEEIFFADRAELLLTKGLDPRQAELFSDHSLDEADRILGECQRLDIQLLTMQDAAYPGRLRDIENPPCLLYVKGRLPTLDEELVIAVVGTRSCTPYGLSCAERLSYGLASGGAIVASGLARGIDAAASRGALLAGGIPLGFAGCGLNVVYPRENAALYADVAAAGALISEYPPGTEPMSGNFPMRNRILSGAALGVLVVEAPARSGALITANAALDQGRDIFAVPGPINAFASRGSNRLIQEGAYLVTDAGEILEMYASRFHLGHPREKPPEPEGPAPRAAQAEPPDGTGDAVRAARSEWNTAAGQPSAAGSADRAGEPPAAQSEPEPLPVLNLSEANLPEHQAAVLRRLDPVTPKQTEDIIEETGLPTRRVLAALPLLEISGYVRQYPGKRYTRLVDLQE